MANGAGKVIYGERDLSATTPGQRSRTVAVVLDVNKGKVGWDLVTNPTQLLNKYTPRGVVEIGMTTALFNALELLKSTNSLYVGRPDTQAKHGTLCLVSQGGAGTLAKLTSPKTNTTGFDFTDKDISFRLYFGKKYTQIKLTTALASWADVVAELNTQIDAGTLNGLVSAVDEAGVLSFVALAGNEGGSEIRVASFSEVTEELTVTTVFGFNDGDRAEGESKFVSYPGGQIDPEDYVFGENEMTLLYGIDPGSWNKLVEVQVRKSSNYPGAFVLDVYYDGAGTPEESIEVSRDPSLKDGNGSTLYIEEAIKASKYLRALDNPMVDADVPFLVTENALQLDGGDNGDAATDGDAILLLEELKNANKYDVRILDDAGRTTPAYAAKIIEVAESRVGLSFRLSIPLSAEKNSDYMAAITKYRKSDMVISSSKGAIVAGWQKIYDPYNDRDVWVAPSSFAIRRTLWNDVNYEIWYPAAGIEHGALTTLDCYRRFSDGELDALDNMGIIPIKWSTDGIHVHGNSTMLALDTALKNLNNRESLEEIAPAVKRSLEGFVYKFNDEETRKRVTKMLESFMENIRGRKGVKEYKIVCNEENNTAEDFDKNIMNVWVFVKFHGVAKYIPVTLAVSSNAVSFTDISL